MNRQGRREPFTKHWEVGRDAQASFGIKLLAFSPILIFGGVSRLIFMLPIVAKGLPLVKVRT